MGCQQNLFLPVNVFRFNNIFILYIFFSEPGRNQLTIFYGGKVLVFDNFPAEKAKDLMNIANKGTATSQAEPTNNTPPPVPVPAPVPVQSPARPTVPGN